MPDTPTVIPIIERRKDAHSPENCPTMATVQERFSAGAARMERIEANGTRLEAKLDANSADTTASVAKIDRVLYILDAAESFFSFCNRAGLLIKWVAGIVAPLVAIWVTIKFGSNPK
jgi:hypothetical protein